VSHQENEFVGGRRGETIDSKGAGWLEVETFLQNSELWSLILVTSIRFEDVGSPIPIFYWFSPSIALFFFPDFMLI